MKVIDVNRKYQGIKTHLLWDTPEEIGPTEIKWDKARKLSTLNGSAYWLQFIKQDMLLSVTFRKALLKRGQATNKTVLLQALLTWEKGLAVPVPVSAKKNDILAGTEFLSVFINGAMAPRPTRRRLSLRRNTTVPMDSVPAESKNDEANIFRISRVPLTVKPTPARPRTTPVRDEGVRYYPISHKFLDNRHHSLETIVDDLNRPGDISSKYIAKSSDPVTKLSFSKMSNKSAKLVNQKVIGVSVTSTVEETPYKVRVEHYDSNDFLTTRPPPVMATTNNATPDQRSSSTVSQTRVTFTSTGVTSTPAKLVTEELNNIVSESNRSEFSVEEGAPKTSSQYVTMVTSKPILRQQTMPLDIHQDSRDSVGSSSNSEPIEQRYKFPEQNQETKEVNHELQEVHKPLLRSQGRKVGRHFDDTTYNQRSKIYNTRQNGNAYDNQHPKVFSEQDKVYGEPEKVYSEPVKVYSEPAKVYGEPSKVYSEPSKVYGEPAKVYSGPEKVYSQPAQVYSEPSKVYSEPAKVYGEPSKVYNTNGQAVGEPEEKNYEVDEAVSVGSNGNVHGPQSFTEATNIDEDGHKVGYVEEGRNYRKYRVEERTPDGFIVGEYGVVSHDDGTLRGVRYTADGTINPRLIYDALMKFLAL
ncbi:uncharacterized protein LOC106639580 [Copidosoma floridanum]|uniref:uncharacterized protein LOC106639580 n=1 Tax=Copidosoma floridanum TaxID=29053 RepID=UPI0006C98F0D|nr:uncharacterized protein LOC106639580 [Copidosoma floridanum]